MSFQRTVGTYPEYRNGIDKEAPEGSGNVHEDLGAEVDNSKEEEADIFDTEGSKDEAEDDDTAVNLRNPDGEFLPPAERRAAGSSINKPDASDAEIEDAPEDLDRGTANDTDRNPLDESNAPVGTKDPAVNRIPRAEQARIARGTEDDDLEDQLVDNTAPLNHAAVADFFRAHIFGRVVADKAHKLKSTDT
ncbi:MAG: hypothetical protein L6R37_006577 [Teloschistes peruensis]|nr:MAG: hypothetical protein L6R37_006577 [Teloschistes peruensis]